MSAEAIAIPIRNERQDSRVPFQGEFEYTCDGLSGTAHWSSMSDQGACVTLGRYLRPTRLIRFSKDGHDIFGSVVWCKPKDNSESFVAGVRFIDGGVEASFMVLSTIVQQMVRNRKKTQRSR
ncbi:MAG: PilZ domain-containing protein [Candidatus Hydrogenedentota bacterium]